ncbi:50S ribosomal protein L11 methyltransferase [Rhodospirillaceae bacterium]|nr:50S ribosomal protein L11 methyltransferase [Rhodospirillaceae bacterium]
MNISAEHAFTFSEILEPFLDSTSIFELEVTRMWELNGFINESPARKDIEEAIASLSLQLKISKPKIKFELVPEIDWVAKNRESFPIIRYGRFIIHGSHDRFLVPKHSFKIEIEAGRAFGSGTHGTTEGCLRALSFLKRFVAPKRILDMGCGSGILSIASARLWPRSKVVALDLDPDAVLTTRENIKLNQVKRQIDCDRSNGYPKKSPNRKTKFDIIVANILAGPLFDMAYDSSRWVNKGGFVILSGLLIHQERYVLAAFRSCGLKLFKRQHISGWSTIILRNSSIRKSAML